MEAVPPSEDAVTVLRAISQAGFSYLPTKALAAAAGWKLVDDEPGLGYVRYGMLLTAGQALWRPLTVQVAESGGARWAFVPLFYFEEYDATREPFDQAFRTLCEQIVRFLGAPSRSGVYNYPHRSNWPYTFAGWPLPDVTLVLVEDEFDIQFGMDVTLWVLPAGTAVMAPMQVE